KHAQATHVSLDVTQGERWTFVVRDNGVGFNPGLAMDETHVGSKIMRERAERIGATVEVRSEPGHGTAVTLSLPPYPVTTSGVGTMGIETPEHPTALP
ncbi:MAG: histidine kinase, partial [Ottowia sp.]|nr:histidine kinase [Ottowia sp.]